MEYCRKRFRHRASECEGNGSDDHREHVKGCKCEYGPGIEDDHEIGPYDDRCREIARKKMFAVMDSASKEVERWPLWMRPDKTPNVHDRIRSACWNMTPEQLERVAKYAEKVAKKK